MKKHELDKALVMIRFFLALTLVSAFPSQAYVPASDLKQLNAEVMFNRQSDEIRAEDRERLKQLAATVKSCPERLRIRIIVVNSGVESRRAEDLPLRILATKRRMAVKNFLVYQDFAGPVPVQWYLGNNADGYSSPDGVQVVGICMP